MQQSISKPRAQKYTCDFSVKSMSLVPAFKKCNNQIKLKKRLHIFINFVCHVQILKYRYIRKKTFICTRVIFRFLPNLQRPNKITKYVKSINRKAT